ncbi:MAG: acetate kinase, partial [Cryptosporangiaceae bacterium]|nr:acetate kinase [Cryptosporangiaceae bacterium]
MTVLVVNSGSSTVKYQLLDPAAGQRIAGGLVERIGEAGSTAPDHGAAMDQVAEQLADGGYDLREATDLTAVGHRIVHGGERFTAATVIDAGVLAAIRDLVPLAPLHNPGGIAGIEAMRAIRPDVPHVAVFDTAFHHGLPARAATYALPTGLAREHQIRRYGFHGTSYAWVSARAAEVLGRPLAGLAMIVLHLGNGASAAAILGGKPVDTSMGLTPLEGLVMGTRSGDVDPAVVFHLHRVAGLDPGDVETVLTAKSGLLGLCGDNDVREVTRRADEGDPDAIL